MKCQIANWRTYQHYKDRNPPWIKLHFSLLSSPDWVMLDDASRVLAIACMLIASRNDGVVDCSPTGLRYLQRVAYLNVAPDPMPLIECGFLVPDSESKQMLADARPETETETETETEQRERQNTGAAAPRPSARKPKPRPKPPDEFGEIREAYPKRHGGQRWDDAVRGYRRAIAEGHTHEELLAAVRQYAKHCDVAGKTGTDTVQQAGTFFGKNRGFLEEYDTTPVKGSKQSAAEEARQQKERDDVKYLADMFRTQQGEGESYEAFRERLFAMNKRRIDALGGDLATKLKTGGVR